MRGRGEDTTNVLNYGAGNVALCEADVQSGCLGVTVQHLAEKWEPEGMKHKSCVYTKHPAGKKTK